VEIPSTVLQKPDALPENKLEPEAESSVSREPDLSIEATWSDGDQSEQDQKSVNPSEERIQVQDSAKKGSKSGVKAKKKPADRAPKLVVGQFVLMLEKALSKKKKISLVMGRVTSVNSKGIGTVQAWKPKRVAKHVHFLPLWWRNEGQKSTDLKITDKKLGSEWNPWEMVTLPSVFQIVAVSHVEEKGDRPPSRFTRFYTQVWDKKIPESSVPEEYSESHQVESKLTTVVTDSISDCSGMKRSRPNDGDDDLQQQRKKRKVCLHVDDNPAEPIFIVLLDQ
jgi:hypothetical protein